MNVSEKVAVLEAMGRMSSFDVISIQSNLPGLKLNRYDLAEYLMELESKTLIVKVGRPIDGHIVYTFNRT